jgi:hypothetical protein
METIRITIPKSLVSSFPIYGIRFDLFRTIFFDWGDIFITQQGDRHIVNTNSRLIINNGDKDIYETKIDIDIDVFIFDTQNNFFPLNKHLLPIEALSASEKEICRIARGNLNVVKFDGYYYIHFNDNNNGYCRVEGISSLSRFIEIYNDLDILSIL